MISSKESINLYLIKVDALPASIADTPFILVDDGADFDCCDEDFSVENIRYLSSLLVKSFHPECVINDFKQWWENNVGGGIDFECLATDGSQLSQSNLDKFENMENDEWLLSASFLGYYLNSENGYIDTRQIVIESDLSVQ